MKTLAEPNPGDRITADLVRDLIRAVRSLTPIQGHGMRLTRGSNGTVYSSTATAKAKTSTEKLPWSFSCTVSAGGQRQGGWSNCLMQIGYDASFGDSSGTHRDLCSDGVYYAEVDLAACTWDLKCISPSGGQPPSKASIPPHDFENNKVNVYIGIVQNAVCTYSIHKVPVVYKYV